MHSLTADGQARLLGWQRVRAFAVPASMIEVATARRLTGDWAGACAAARVDVDFDLRTVTAARGRELAALVRADLRRLAPDLLRWHLPRATPGGRLRPALTLSLARYPGPAHDVHLVVRTAPSWADAGQHLSLALWDPATTHSGPHPRPRPDRRFRLDLHPHLWAADRAADLRERCGADVWPASAGPAPADRVGPPEPAWRELVPPGRGHAAHRWAAEAAILRAADGHPGPVTVRLGGRRRLLIHAESTAEGDARGHGAVLPYAATWLPPDLELLHAGLISAGMLHPLVAEALAPAAGPGPRSADPVPGGPRLVECRGATHRLGLVDGVLAPLDHDPEELRREDLLASLGGPPLPCLRVTAATADDPAYLDEVRAHLAHGDHAGAWALVAELLGPRARPEGALREAFTEAENGRIAYGLYRAGLAARAEARLRPNRAGRRSRHHRLPRRAATSG